MPSFRGMRIKNSRILECKNVGRWRSLELNSTAVDDLGFEFLGERATALTELTIASDLLTDRGFLAICQLPHLTSLLIHFAPCVTDQGISGLANLVQLKQIYLDRTQITDSGRMARG